MATTNSDTTWTQWNFAQVEKQRDEARMWARRMKYDRDGYRELYHEMQAANRQAWGVAVQRLQRIGELERENENRRAFTDTLEEVKNALRHRVAELEAQLATLETERESARQLLASGCVFTTEQWDNVVEPLQDRIRCLEAQLAKWRTDAIQCAGEASQYSSEATYAEVKREMENAAASKRIAELESQLAARNQRTCETCRRSQIFPSGCPAKLMMQSFRRADIGRTHRRHARESDMGGIGCSEWQEREA